MDVSVDSSPPSDIDDIEMIIVNDDDIGIDNNLATDAVVIPDVPSTPDVVPKTTTKKKREPMKPIAIEAKELLDVVALLPLITDTLDLAAADPATGSTVAGYLRTASKANERIRSDLLHKIGRVSKISQIVEAHGALTAPERAQQRRLEALSTGKRKPRFIVRLEGFLKTEGVSSSEGGRVVLSRRVSSRSADAAQPSMIVTPVKIGKDTVDISFAAPRSKYYSENEIVSILQGRHGKELDRHLAALVRSNRLLKSSIVSGGGDLSSKAVLEYYCTVTTPLPIDAKVGYGKIEAAEYLSQYEGAEKAARTRALIATGLNPVKSFSQMYQIVADFKVGKDLREYGDTGRKKRVDAAAISERALKKAKKGEKVCLDDVQEYVRDGNLASMEARGVSLLNQTGELSRTTAVTTLAEVAMTGALAASSAAPSAVENIRHASTTSLRMADSQSQALIATQYLTGTKPNDPNWSFFDETKLTEGSKRSLVKARRVRGDDNVYPVHPMLTFSTDETYALTIHGVKASSRYEIGLVDSSQDYATRSLKEEKTWSSAVARLKLLMTFNAMGYMAPVFVSIACSEKELPRENTPTGIRFCTVRGLAPASTTSLSDAASSEVGYLVLLRADNDSEVGVGRKKANIYMTKILLPFIDLCRRHLEPSANLDPNAIVPEYLTAVSWCDGDIAQVQEVLSRADALLSRRTRCCKHGAKTSGTAQFADLMKCFSIIKSEMENNTAAGKGNVGIHGNVEKLFKEMRDRGIINFDHEKEKAIRDGIKILPDVLYKACDKKKIQKGFKEGGYDFETGTVNETKILSNFTRGREVTEVEWGEDTWDDRHKMMLADGQITEAMYDQCGFPQGTSSHFCAGDNELLLMLFQN